MQLTPDQLANYTDRALLIAIAKELFSRNDTLQSSVANLSTAVGTIATKQGDVMTGQEALTAEIVALKAQMQQVATYIQTTVPAAIAAAVAAAQAGDNAAAQAEADDLKASGDALVATLPVATPPDQGSTGAP